MFQVETDAFGDEVSEVFVEFQYGDGKVLIPPCNVVPRRITRCIVRAVKEGVSPKEWEVLKVGDVINHPNDHFSKESGRKRALRRVLTGELPKRCKVLEFNDIQVVQSATTGIDKPKRLNFWKAYTNKQALDKFKTAIK